MSVKTFATFAIIIGCFAVLYPKFLHPMMNRFFGSQSKSAHDEDEGDSQFYPPGRGSNEKQPNTQPNIPSKAHSEARQHMRAGPHPGMRAASEMHRQQSQHGSGRGMMGIVLPMYAIGIVLYLVYTLVKVFGKKEKDVESSSYERAPYPPSPPVDPLSPKQKTKQLQNLLLKADDKTISNEEMKELQTRLEETEAQMSQILQAMQLVQNKVVGEEVNTDKTQKEAPAANTQTEQVPKAPDSSPDMDSYEIVNKKKEGSTPDVDTVQAEEVAGQNTGKGAGQEGGAVSGEGKAVKQDDSETANDSRVAAEKGDDDAVAAKKSSGVSDSCGKDGKEVVEETVEVIPEAGGEEPDTDSSVRHRPVHTQDSC